MRRRSARQRLPHAKAAAFAESARDLNLRAMRRTDRLHDRQSEACAASVARVARPRVIDAEETLENMWQGLGRNSNSIVRHVQHRIAVLTRDLQANGAAPRGVLDRVVQQVDDHLL